MRRRTARGAEAGRSVRFTRVVARRAERSIGEVVSLSFHVNEFAIASQGEGGARLPKRIQLRFGATLAFFHYSCPLGDEMTRRSPLWASLFALLCIFFIARLHDARADRVYDHCTPVDSHPL